ncbi:Gfo/Idh/MocA family oxidoreductase [Mycetocola sp. 2940]|uniref:Gfo/Idh/MocA family oxidoreductase n=1 Tax=Mycetocola sp. 2940 TaxID=3156452 RepID=UPI003399FAF1
MTPGPATVAILGAGTLARTHARVVVAHPDLRLVAIVDPDAASGAAMIERIVHRFEGERALLFADLDSALAALAIDIVAIGEIEDSSAAGQAVAAGKTVVGGNRDPGDSGPGRWFPFDDASSRDRQGSVDAAFSDHVRQYENVLSSMGRGPLAASSGADV